MSKKKFNSALLLSTSLFLTIAAEPALAADQSADTGAGDTAGDIVVTARRKEERIQDVPVAITALSGNDLAQKGVTNAQDLRGVTPGLNISGLTRDSATFYIRGQQPGNLTSGARSIPGVATYYAEVPTDLPSTGVFFDLQNVQILKGPQGTLFGRNTTGGAVLFEPHRPVHGLNGGEVEVQLGNYNFKSFSGFINVAPVPDVLAIRVAGEVQRRDGYTTSILTGQAKDNRKHEAFRASILLTPSDAFENLTIVDYRNSDTNGTGLVPNLLNPTAVVSAATIPGVGTFPIRLGGTVSVACLSPLAGCPGGPAAAIGALLSGGSLYLVAPTSTWNQIAATQAAIGPRFNQSPFLTGYLDKSIGVVNKTTIRLSDTLTVKNIISYKQRRQREALDYTGTPLPLLQQLGPIGDAPYTFGSNLFTEELQLQGNLGSMFNYILGGYYEHEAPGIRQTTRGFAVGSPSIRSFGHTDISKAAFAHAEWTPIPMLTLAGGIRRTWDQRTADISVYKADAVTCNQTDLTTGKIACPIVGSKNFASMSYDFTASVKPVDGLMVYAAYRRGYKAGGLNVPVIPGPASNPLAFASYGPEYVDDFEVGLKFSTVIAGMPIRLNLAGFSDSYKDEQISVQVQFANPDGSTSFTSAIQNVAASSIKGVEGELNIEPVHGLRLGGFASYLDAHPKFDVKDVRGTTVALASRQLPNQPKYKWGLNGSFTQDLAGDNGEVTLSANYAWQSSWHPSLLTNIGDPKPAYGVANARIQWDRVMGSRLDLAFFMNNVFDKTYILGGYPIATLGADSVVYGEPRMFGGSIKFHFGSQ